jgi:capsular exopolysaccharide synthesis family protein
VGNYGHHERAPGVVTSAPLSLRDYLSILWRRKWLILAITMTTTAITLFYSSKQTPSYSTSSEVVVESIRFDRDPSAPTLLPDMNTEERIANSAPVAALATERLGDAAGEADTSAATREGTTTIEFSSASADPHDAQAAANAYASAYLELRRDQTLRELEALRSGYQGGIAAIRSQLDEISQEILRRDPSQTALLQIQYQALLARETGLEQSLAELVSTVNLDVGQILTPAPLPGSPSGPGPASNATLGIVLGLALGVATALIRDRLDERVRGREELEIQSRAPVLAFIPRVRSRSNGFIRRNRSRAKGKLAPIITLEQPASEAAEAYKGLAVRLLHLAPQKTVKTIVITSSVADEGKTTTTANLGAALAVAGKRVVLVSADLRRPGLQRYFYLDLTPALADLIRDRRKALEALSFTSTENLWVLHAGLNASVNSPLELLATDAMAEVVADLRDFADFVLIDTPPILSASDVSAVAPLADGVLIVVDPRRVEGSLIEEARQEIQLTGAPVIGVVVNRYDPRHFRRYSSAYVYRYHNDGSASGGEAGGSIVPLERTEPF